MIGEEIDGLFLAPSAHGRGLGRAISDDAVARQGPLRVEALERNAIGLRSYDRWAFVETERHVHEPTGEVILKMAISSS